MIIVQRTTIMKSAVLYEVLVDNVVEWNAIVHFGTKACSRPGGADFVQAARIQASKAKTFFELALDKRNANIDNKQHEL